MNHLLYLDPGSGSYLVQALVAGALGVVFFFRNIVTYIRTFFATLFGKKTADKTDLSNSSEPDPE
jgi:hypothetical protein